MNDNTIGFGASAEFQNLLVSGLYSDDNSSWQRQFYQLKSTMKINSVNYLTAKLTEGSIETMVKV